MALAINAEVKKAGKNDELVEEVMDVIREVLDFNPAKSTYTKELGKRIIEWRKEKAKETGSSYYVISGAKECYERKRMQK